VDHQLRDHVTSSLSQFPTRSVHQSKYPQRSTGSVCLLSTIDLACAAFGPALWSNNAVSIEGKFSRGWCSNGGSLAPQSLNFRALQALLSIVDLPP